ncbi:lysoplasmalogenase [Paenibacillus guangzhouensis]|uniref:lysoplasmalogenase n=1 Tax=Paenibacillus guangzhouensis TaxID=1473112 RepID=UPI00187B7844|nr:lysoplasmalogenase [Paenibacillus guangzhouensis]
MVQRGLILAILVCGGIHLATLQLDVALIHWVFKLLPMLLILVLAVRSKSMDRTRAYKGLIVAGLLFSMAGDTFLLNAGDRWFMLGLGSFFIGHLLYIAAMVRRWQYTWLGLLWILPIGAYSGFVGSQLHEGIMGDPSQNGLWLPVLAYVCVISVMCWLALMSRNAYAAVGSILFVASDSILAWNKFIGSVPASGFLVMLTYFAAQALIACSIANGLAGKKSTDVRGMRM